MTSAHTVIRRVIETLPGVNAGAVTELIEERLREAGYVIVGPTDVRGCGSTHYACACQIRTLDRLETEVARLRAALELVCDVCGDRDDVTFCQACMRGSCHACISPVERRAAVATHPPRRRTGRRPSPGWR